MLVSKNILGIYNLLLWTLLKLLNTTRNYIKLSEYLTLKMVVACADRHFSILVFHSFNDLRIAEIFQGCQSISVSLAIFIHHARVLVSTLYQLEWKYFGLYPPLIEG